jgi:hypothetical protein
VATSRATASIAGATTSADTFQYVATDTAHGFARRPRSDGTSVTFTRCLDRSLRRTLQAQHPLRGPSGIDQDWRPAEDMHGISEQTYYVIRLLGDAELLADLAGRSCRGRARPPPHAASR